MVPFEIFALTIELCSSYFDISTLFLPKLLIDLKYLGGAVSVCSKGTVFIGNVYYRRTFESKK